MHLEDWRQRCRSHTGAENLEQQAKRPPSEGWAGKWRLQGANDALFSRQPSVYKVRQHQLHVHTDLRALSGVGLFGGQFGREVIPRHIFGNHLPGGGYLKLWGAKRLPKWWGRKVGDWRKNWILKRMTESGDGMRTVFRKARGKIPKLQRGPWKQVLRRGQNMRKKWDHRFSIRRETN